MQPSWPVLHFEFPNTLLPPGVEDVRIAVAFWRGVADPALLEGTIESEWSSRVREIAHPERRFQSLLARRARDELLRRESAAVVGPTSSPVAPVSYSHTAREGGVAAAAAWSTRGRPVGVDIEFESRLRGREQVFRRILTEHERQALLEVEPGQRSALAIQLWCAKEALSKALGTGLVAPIDRYETRLKIDLEAPQNHFLVEFRNYPQWRVLTSRVSGLIVATCIPQDEPSRSF